MELLYFVLIGLGMAAIGMWWIYKMIRIIPVCEQCDSLKCEIYASNVKEAWLDCKCHMCGYKWRIK